jgi:DNA circularisation protein N-terminus
MAALQDLVRASFRGVQFLTPSGTAEGGRHSIKHEYPDSNTRYVEDNGLVVPDYKLKCVIHGADALSRLRSFEAALNRPGPGTLVHPIYGRRFVQVMGPFSTKHDDNNVGVYEVDVTFAVTGPPIFPGLLSGIAAAIVGMSAGALGVMFAAFQAGFSIPISLASQLALSSATTSIIGQMASSFGASAVMKSVSDTINSFPDELIRDPSTLAAALERAVQAPIDATDDIIPSELWSGYIKVYDAANATNDAAAAIEADTLDKLTRKDGLLLLANTMSAAAICGLCVAAAAKEYSTSDEVQADSGKLVNLFNQLVDNYGDALGPVPRETLSELVNETVIVLQESAVSLPNISQLRVWQMPASVMTYFLYDSDASLPTIMDLNEAQTPILYDGDVNVLHS